MQTRLTVPISAGDLEQAKEQIEAAILAGAEMLELRVDYLERLNPEMVKGLVAHIKADKEKSLPVIVTCRDKKQGGANDYPVQLRVDVLIGALKAGAEFVDFEYENFLSPEYQGGIQAALSQSVKSRLILSAHDFEAKFPNIGKLYRHIQTLSPAAIPKLVYTAKHINDCFDAFDLLHQTSGERIVFCMGEAGLISRIIAKKLGSLVSFASIDDAAATASGQLTIQQLKELYRWDSINAGTDLYGVIADPVGHSVSPAVHNACFAEAELNKLYLPLHVEGSKAEFERFMDNVLRRNWLGFKGFSVTIPHKETALSYVKEKKGFVEPLAEKIGAVNTLLISADGGFKAYNTDYSGALDAITSGLGKKRAKLKDMGIAIIGAGGVARAIAAGLRDAGARITIYNRTVERGRKLAAEFNCNFEPLEKLQDMDAELLINCTSIGMRPNTDATPLPREYLKKDMAVFDTVYNPPETLLLKQAKEIGAKTIDGVSMFVNQAAEQFKFFAGKNANTKLMRETICENLNR